MHSSQRIAIGVWNDETVVNGRPAQEFVREHQSTRPDPEEVRASLPASLPSRRDLASLAEDPRARGDQRLVVFVLLLFALATAVGAWLVTRV